MKFSTSSLTLLAASITLANAATLDQCSISLLGLVSDPGLNTCLPMQQLSSLVSAPLITPLIVNNTATALCSLPICPTASVALVQSTVTQNCVNATDPATAELVLGAASLYPPFRDGMCQRIPGGNGTFCITELAQTMSDYLTKHPSPLGIKIFANSTVLQQYVADMPTALLCTPCNKAIINPIQNYITANKATMKPTILEWANILNTGAASKCGADFTNGQKPTATAGSASPTGGASGSGAEGMKIGGGSMAALAVAIIGALF
ncbi:hypothetical protein KI688_009659 [Linnemannia hyalina]|uniref:Uncharacterized protein n=1 Tax=Linnemannia hyalina TaxID=64524 RepID=A0A9P7Y063_9FUNG|nr:hypothetical protein KI688_009659 [Linnemannia hyalina]